MRVVLADISFANIYANTSPQELEKQLGTVLSHHRREWRGRVILFYQKALQLVQYNLYSNQVEFTFDFQSKLVCVNAMRRPRHSVPYYAAQLFDGYFMVAVTAGSELLEFSSTGIQVHQYKISAVVAMYELKNKSVAVCSSGGGYILYP